MKIVVVYTLDFTSQDTPYLGYVPLIYLYANDYS